ncbi:MAG: exonuclease domain-containing protein, partial [Actinomycetota bacterium]|nr:exonuclease domain-containing protein [Actinomycetota bacterium]
MSSSLYGFVKDREPVSPEEVASEFLALARSNGDSRAIVEDLVGDDPRFAWEEEVLRTVDPASLALEEAPYVVFDVETTGPAAGKGGAITEFGALKLVRGEVVEEFSTLVNPGRPIDPFVVRLTGITDRLVSGAPYVSEVMPRFERFVEGSVLVGHNVHFDCSFVTAARGGAALPNPVLDTLKLSRCLVPGLGRYRLSSLVGHFGVRQAPNHRALS